MLPDEQTPPTTITLRDFFAGLALTGLVNREYPEPPQVIARKAYTLADAMLIAAVAPPPA